MCSSLVAFKQARTKVKHSADSGSTFLDRWLSHGNARVTFSASCGGKNEVAPQANVQQTCERPTRKCALRGTVGEEGEKVDLKVSQLLLKAAREGDADAVRRIMQVFHENCSRLSHILPILARSYRKRLIESCRVEFGRHTLSVLTHCCKIYQAPLPAL